MLNELFMVSMNYGVFCGDLIHCRCDLRFGEFG
jgi:hypothetical protein